MKPKYRMKWLLAACAFAVGLGISLSAYARPCCSSCDSMPPDRQDWCYSVCTPGC